MAETERRPRDRQFLADVLAGLQEAPKHLPCKYLYDERGSRLFDKICRLDEYYLTRAETEIMRRRGGEMAACLGTECVVVEYGSGSSSKTTILLDHLSRPRAYVPVDISGEYLEQIAQQLSRRYPDLEIKPLAVDFTQPFRLPALQRPGRRTVGYFPGSTIGNFGPAEATGLLQTIRQTLGEEGGLLIGVDLHKSREVLEAAYNDASGVTAEFNLNLLRRINRELGADFDPSRFRHSAVFNESAGRIEMHLVCRADHTVRVAGHEIPFRAGETIHTENSYKYSLRGFREIAGSAGWQVGRIWRDADGLFSVQYLTGERGAAR